MKNKSKTSKVFLLWALLSVYTAVLIFRFSAQNGEASGALSQGIVTNLLQSFVSAENLDNAERILRKLAHFGIYLFFGLSLFYSSYYYKNCRNKQEAGEFSFCTAFMYAVSDEFHQLFVPDRNCSTTDIMIDSFGALFGIGIAILILKLIAKINKKSKLVP